MTVDYQAVCKDCGRQEVFAQNQGEQVLIDLLDYLAQEVGLLIPASYDFELNLPEEFEPYRQDQVPLGAWVRGTRKMHVRPGLPRWLFSAVAAHQHAYAWQASECHAQSPVLIECFARWIQLKILEGLDCADHFEALQHQGRQYQQGLDYLLDLEEESGPKGLVTELRQMRDFPPVGLRGPRGLNSEAKNDADP